MNTCDFLVIGGGIIGLSIARELKYRHSKAKIIVLEKEHECGAHASGRNSGVLHAGFYYTADSLKARFTRDGNRLMTEYCESRSIPVNKCGKLVVARNEQEDKVLDELLARAHSNSVMLEQVSARDMAEIEPRASTWSRALYSPATSSVDPRQVMKAIEEDAKVEGIEVHRDVKYVGHSGKTVQTTKGGYQAGYIVNAAGLYADKIARDFGFSDQYRIMPFKGVYLKSEEPKGSIRTNVYPVPDLRNPFLGVHFTVQVDGAVKIGPTAIPALWREQYNRVSNFQLAEFVDVAYRTTGMLFNAGFDFKRLAVSELAKHSRRKLVSLAAELVKDISVNNYRTWAKPGIRAQLINIRDRSLVMDFVVESDDSSMHVLNAVSPAFTCSVPIARYICKAIEQRIH